MPSSLAAYNMLAQEFGWHGVGGRQSSFMLKHIENDFLCCGTRPGSMHFEGDMHHVDMQFAFSMIHINVISLTLLFALSFP